VKPAKILASSHAGYARRSVDVVAGLETRYCSRSVTLRSLPQQRRSAVETRPRTSHCSRNRLSPPRKRPLSTHRGQRCCGRQKRCNLKMIRAASTPCQCMQTKVAGRICCETNLNRAASTQHPLRPLKGPHVPWSGVAHRRVGSPRPRSVRSGCRDAGHLCNEPDLFRHRKH
jgi:hypothetical protein